MRYHSNFEEWYEYYQLQWNVEWLKENFFSKLRINKELNLPFYDSDHDTHEWKKVKIPITCLIIIEGVFLQRSEWKNYLDYTLFMNCSRDTRFSRETESTQRKIEKFRERYWKAEDYYLKKVSPEKQADIVLNS
jgi:uridine kinase